MTRKSYKFRIQKPSKQIEARMLHTLDLCRELYNAGLQERRDAWRVNRVSISYYDQQNQLPELKKIRTDLNDVYAQVLRESLKRLDDAFRRFFRHAKAKQSAGFPRFKSKERFNSFCYPEAGKQGCVLIGNRLKLSKIGTVKLHLSRRVIGAIKTLTVKYQNGKWFVIVSCDNVPTTSLAPTNQSVGIDVGIESFATLSDGTQIDNWKYYESSAKQLRVAQRRVSRRKKGSNRRRKAVAILRNIHQKIFNQRHDFQHNLSTNLINNYDLIAVEKLNVKGMSQGILPKQILDVSWSSFFYKLKYKAENAGRELIEVNPAYTSQDCSRCGNREKKKLSQREHNCGSCGLILHRDHNAALNILALGQSVLGVTYSTG